MTDEVNASSGSGEANAGASARSPTIFVCDPSVEGARLADVLRAAGYIVADVPLAQLAARASVQKPAVVLLDIDPSGALVEVLRLRKLAGAGSIDFVYLGTGGGPIRNADDALANDGSAFFTRPIDLGGVMRKIEALTGGPSASARVRATTPPPSIPVSRGHTPSSRDPAPSSSERGAASSLPARGLRTPGPPLPMSTPSLSDLVDPPRSLASFAGVSAELQQLLADAELRVEGPSTGELAVPTPEEELEAVLPADVLASLDEPLDPHEDEDAALEVGVRPVNATGTQADGPSPRPTTSGGSRSPTTGSGLKGPGTGAQITHERKPTDAPPRSASVAPATGTRPLSSIPQPAPTAPSLRSSAAPRAASPPEPIPSAPQPIAPVARGSSAQRPATLVVAASGARRFVGDAIARRASGALCFEHQGVVRRIVLRDGDLVTAASSDEGEGLVGFLSATGELSREEAQKLVDKVPPYGRHAGAALVAHGLLGQDQLWPSLRAHAEWLATLVLRTPGGTAVLEPEPPGRLRTEPSVFGASTGPSIFVDLVRRAVPPEEALELVGGTASRIGDGPNGALLVECALPPADVELLGRMRGGSVGDLLARAPDGEIASTLHALAMLGIVEIVTAPEFGRRPDSSSSAPEIAALDEEAVRVRVRARLELVEDGDYFAVLGVARDVTGYDIRRAYVELRRAFEPARILTPRLADLLDDVKKILGVIDEAYEILREPARRERYRRAIEARP